MKLTPLDIRHKEFRRSMRGYSEEDVDVFLDEVADEFERLFQENLDLRDRIQRLEEQVTQHEGMKETLQKTLVAAQQQADDTRAHARKEGELVLRDAELKARDIVSEGYAEKQRVQQSLIQLRQIEEDFRFKFRALLEAHLNLLAEDEISDERRQFRGLVAGVEQELRATDPVAAEPRRTPSAVAVAAGPVGVAGGGAGPSSSTSAQETSAQTAPPAAPAAADVSVSSPTAAGDTVPPAPTPSDEPDMNGYAQRLPDSTGEGPRYEPVEEDRKPSGVKRFFFGKKEKEASDLFDEDDRDFQW